MKRLLSGMAIQSAVVGFALLIALPAGFAQTSGIGRETE